MESVNHRFDLVSLGECLVEFSSIDQMRYNASWAGDAVNTLFYASKLGLKTGFISAVGDDIFTSMILDGLAKSGIDTRMMPSLPGYNNGLYFIELDQRGEYSFHFRRNDSAARERLLQEDHLSIVDYISQSKWFIFSGITVAVMKGKEHLLAILEHVKRKGTTSIAFDMNYRPALWESTGEYVDSVQEVLPYVDLLLPSSADLRHINPTMPVYKTLEQFMGENPIDTVLTLGTDGCHVRCHPYDQVLSQRPSQKVVDTTGAGDAFNAGLLAGIMRHNSPVKGAMLGQRIAQHVITVRGAIDHYFSERTIVEDDVEDA